MSLERIVGIDVGATNLRVGLGNKKGKLLKKAKEKTVNTRDPENLLDQIERLIRKVTEKTSFQKIVIGAAGKLEKESLSFCPPNLRYEKVSFKPLEKKFETEVELLNDTTLAALGEKKFGAAKGYDNFIYLTLSTGIGAGIYIDGGLLKGKEGNAGEVGHLIVNYDSEFKEWEECASGKHLPKFLKKKYGKKLTCKEFFKRASEGKDEKLERAFKEIVKINAIGIANLVDAYDPGLIVLGGGLVSKRKGKLFFRKIKEKVPDFCINKVPKMKITPLGEYITLYGALAL